MSHSQATKDFLNNLADKLRQLQFEAEEHYTALKHPLPDKDEAEWDRIIGSIMGAVNTAQWPDAADPLEPVYSHLDEPVDPEPVDRFETFYGRPRLTLVERYERIHFPDTDLT